MAAIEVAADAAVTVASDTATSITPLLDSLSSVFAQFSKGISSPTIAFTDISKFGGEPLDSWKAVIEQALNVRLELRVSLETNAITLIPQRPHMSPNAATLLEPVDPDKHVLGDEDVATPASEGTSTSASSAKKAGGKGRAKDKAPRPKNAFIIYRKEWHPKVVANFPDLHNNDISVLIGRQWKDEPDEVKKKYRDMAAEEKRQHLIDHPGYQYQPRKPSEKKKRMTKNKLAKLRAQSVDAGQDPMQEINGLLAAAAADNQATIDTFPAPYRQGFPMITEDHGHNGFVANSEHDDLLSNQLAAWNANQPASQHGPVPALAGQMYVDGQHQRDTPSYAVPVSYNVQNVYKATERIARPGPNAPTATGNITGAAHNSEVDRHQFLFDDALMNDLFDLDAFDVDIN